jgi:hypothetical protein
MVAQGHTLLTSWASVSVAFLSSSTSSSKVDSTTVSACLPLMPKKSTQSTESKWSHSATAGADVPNHAENAEDQDSDIVATNIAERESIDHNLEAESEPQIEVQTTMCRNEAQ